MFSFFFRSVTVELVKIQKRLFLSGTGGRWPHLFPNCCHCYNKLCTGVMQRLVCKSDARVIRWRCQTIKYNWHNKKAVKKYETSIKRNWFQSKFMNNPWFEMNIKFDPWRGFPMWFLGKNSHRENQYRFKTFLFGRNSFYPCSNFTVFDNFAVLDY